MSERMKLLYVNPQIDIERKKMEQMKIDVIEQMQKMEDTIHDVDELERAKNHLIDMLEIQRMEMVRMEIDAAKELMEIGRVDRIKVELVKIKQMREHKDVNDDMEYICSPCGLIVSSKVELDMHKESHGI